MRLRQLSGGLFFDRRKFLGEKATKPCSFIFKYTHTDALGKEKRENLDPENLEENLEENLRKI